MKQHYMSIMVPDAPPHTIVISPSVNKPQLS